MPQPSPGTLRSPRKRALEIGTDRSKFPDGVAYDPSAGTPAGDSGGSYQEPVERGPAPGPGGPNPSPFSNLR